MVIGVDGSRAFIKNRTGTENYSYELIRHLSLIDKVNTYQIFLRPGTKGQALHGWPANFQFITINFPRLWTQAGLALKTFTAKIDVLFVPAHTIPLIRKPGLKTVMTIHDLGAEYLPFTHQIKQRLYLKFITNIQLKSVTRLIAVSKATKEDLIKKAGLSSEKISVIYEGYDHNLLKFKDSDAKVSILKQFGIENKKYFFFVGSIQPRKNLERLIQAFKIFLDSTPHNLNSKPYNLVLAGSKGWLADSIYELPKKLGIADSVKFTGRISEQELAVLFSSATALTYPSLFEGFGLPILEAFACNCPVLTSKTSSMPEIAGKAAILVDPYNVDDIARAMNFITKEEVRKKLIADGKAQLQNFSWEKCAKETLQLIKEVGDGKH